MYTFKDTYLGNNESVLVEVNTGPLRDRFKYSKKFDVCVYDEEWVKFDHQTGIVKVLPVEQTAQGKQILEIIESVIKPDMITQGSKDLETILEEVTGVVGLDINHKLFSNAESVKQFINKDFSDLWLVPAKAANPDVTEKKEQFTYRMKLPEHLRRMRNSAGNQSALIKTATSLKYRLDNIQNVFVRDFSVDFWNDKTEANAVDFIDYVSVLWEVCRLYTMVFEKLLETFKLDTPRTPINTFADLAMKMMNAMAKCVNYSPLALYTEKTGGVYGAYYSEDIKNIVSRAGSDVPYHEVISAFKKESERFKYGYTEFATKYEDLGVMYRAYVQHLSAAHLAFTFGTNISEKIRDKHEYYSKTLSFDLFYKEVYPKLVKFKETSTYVDLFPNQLEEYIDWMVMELEAMTGARSITLHQADHPF